MSRLHDSDRTFGEGNVTLLMVLGVMSYCDRMRDTLDTAVSETRPPRSKRKRAAASVERLHPVDLAVLGVEALGLSVATLCGDVPEPPARTPRIAPAARRALRQVLR
jgi:hypothetical protein